MFTVDTSDENKLIVNAIQEIPIRLSVYGINKCEDQVIGFEFISKKYQNNPKCCGNAIVNLCVPVEAVNSITLDKAEFYATDDPCYREWMVKKTESPEIEIQRDLDNKATGILIRFSKDESCCYPPNMSYKLYAYDSLGCKFSLSTGLLIFR